MLSRGLWEILNPMASSTAALLLKVARELLTSEVNNKMRKSIAESYKPQPPPHCLCLTLCLQLPLITA